MSTHDLKISTIYFDDPERDVKTFEIRKNDRDFKVNDIVIIKEFDGKNLTGRELTRRITYITSFQQKKGYVVFGIK